MKKELMSYNKLIIIPLCCLAGLAFAACAVVALTAREPATLALETASQQAQADAANARATEAEAQAELASAQANLVSAQGYAQALQEMIDAVTGMLTWSSLQTTFSPPVYLFVGSAFGGCAMFFAGAYWGAERERKRAESKHVLVNMHDGRAGGVQ